jgi:hypothetical protein
MIVGVRGDLARRSERPQRVGMVAGERGQHEARERHRRGGEARGDRGAVVEDVLGVESEGRGSTRTVRPRRELAERQSDSSTRARSSRGREVLAGPLPLPTTAPGSKFSQTTRPRPWVARATRSAERRRLPCGQHRPFDEVGDGRIGRERQRSIVRLDLDPALRPEGRW